VTEHAFIARYLAPLATDPGAWGLKDDAAEFVSTPGRRLVLTTDTLVEGVHFLPSDPPETWGPKLLAVNVSDALAKGARPAACLLNLSWPPALGEPAFAAFAQGLGDALSQWGVRLLGGDTTATPGPLVLSLTLLAEAPPRGPVRRSGASAGQVLALTDTAPIGLGGLGLAVARGEGLVEAALGTRALAHYRRPDVSPLAAADLIAAYATASLDVSDGLLIDANRLAQASGVGVEIALDRVGWPVADAPLSQRLGWATAGDDYQALFTVPADAWPALQADAAKAAVPLRAIGHTRAGPAGLTLTDAGVGVALPARLGFEHGL
jgi:thiamine-monophosphate kinase